MKLRNETLQRRAANFLFWAWHVIYTVLVIGVFIPYISWPLMESVINNNVPAHYLLYALIMALLPFFSIYIGITHLRTNFRSLMKYFYGFEMPLLFFLLVRMSTFRDSNHGMDWMLINVLIALAVWFIFLWRQHQQDSDQPAYPESLLAHAGSTVLAGVGLYFGILFLIWMLPDAVAFFTGLAHALLEIQLTDLLQTIINPLFWLAIIFIIFTMTLFIALPVVMIYLYIGQFIKRRHTLLTPARIAIVLSVILVNIGMFSYLNQQPQQAIFSLLDEKLEQKAAHEELLQQAPQIRAALLNAYLARYRYISTDGLSQRIQFNYSSILGLSDSLASIPQQIFNALAKPFLYDGKDWSDTAKAERYYAAFFDAPIQKAERETIVSAVKHNWEMSRDNEAGLLDAANHTVHLREQSITLQETQGVATITVSQTLVNLTDKTREAVLHFRLPDDAVISGLWLSNDPIKPHKYPAVLAPRGAAQAVYKAQVQRRIDPALLEQTGPWQYRLRIYPIPRIEQVGQPAKPVYVQFSYQTLIQSEQGKAGYWPLPTVLEKRNLFADKHTEQHINGKKITVSHATNIFPDKLPAPSPQAFLSPLVYQKDNTITHIIARQKSKETLPDHGHFAILIDGSYSMCKHQQSIKDSLAQLSSSQAHFDPYFCQQRCTTDIDKQIFFGNSQTADQLSAFSQLPNANDYDAIFLLSDTGSYELISKTHTETIKLSPPVWLVHLDQTLPYAYDDSVLDLIHRSKGGISLSLKDALVRYQFSNQQYSSYSGENSHILATNEHHTWLQSSPSQPEQSTANNPALAKLVAAQQVKYLSHTLDTRQINNLDNIHALAKQNNIVTRYSSLLVLVNDRQKEALKKAEASKDRFQREIETGKQTTTAPIDPFAVPSVPEPQEWALLIIAGLLLGTAVIRRFGERCQVNIRSL